MNEDQACRRIKTILRSLRWGGSGDPVFGRDAVLVTVAPVEDQLSSLAMPAAFVRGGAGRNDPERPGLVTQEMSVTVVVSVPGDKTGERPLIGANRASKTSWGGRGIYEVQVPMLSAIERIGPGGQFGIEHKATSRLGVQAGDGGYHAFREYGFEALLTTAYMHQEPRTVTAANVAGTVTVAWAVPDDVANLVGYVVRRASGSLPAAFPTDGTSITWSSGLSVTNAPGSGTWTYSVFATYDDEGGSYALHHSDCGWATVVI